MYYFGPLIPENKVPGPGQYSHRVLEINSVGKYALS